MTGAGAYFLSQSLLELGEKASRRNNFLVRVLRDDTVALGAHFHELVMRVDPVRRSDVVSGSVVLPISSLTKSE